jgi:hypothetical protein
MQSDKLIQKQIEQTKEIINQVERLKHIDIQTLTWKENENSWSMLECLEHLNLYGDFYFPQIESKIKNSKTKNELVFKTGLLGNYFAKSMLPKEKLNKMKTFKDKNPIHSKLDTSVINKFLSQQFKLLDLLNLSQNVSLNKIKIETSISKMLKLKLGDTFQFIINHNIRHIKQIENIQKKI